MYNGKEYPQMVSGSGYVMTYGAAECVYKEVLKIPFFHLEDVLLTGFARQVSFKSENS
jgi:beta-1,3-galactosyltransferase 1